MCLYLSVNLATVWSHKFHFTHWSQNVWKMRIRAVNPHQNFNFYHLFVHFKFILNWTKRKHKNKQVRKVNIEMKQSPIPVHCQPFVCVLRRNHICTLLVQRIWHGQKWLHPVWGELTGDCMCFYTSNLKIKLLIHPLIASTGLCDRTVRVA